MWADAEGPSKLPSDVGQSGSTNGHMPPPAEPEPAAANLGWYAVNAVQAAEPAAPASIESENPTASLPMAETPADTDPDVVVDSGSNDLALGQFFRPAMWGLAWIPILLTGLLSYAFLVRATESVTLWPYSQPAYVDALGHLPPVGMIGRHLLPTGMPQSVASSASFGQEQSTIIIQGDLLMGIFSLLVGFMFVVMITRRSNDALYVCGPYAVYSLIAVALLSTNGPLFDGLAGLFPALLGSIVLPLLVATGAKIAAIAMRNAGVFDIDQDQTAFENLDFNLKTDSPATGSVALAGQPGEPRLAAQLQGTDAMPIEHAQVCPFCGNPNIQHEQPRMCNACHHNLQLVFEWRTGPRCSDCDGILVRDAVFCHHCGKWQKSQEAGSESEEATVQGAA